MGNSPSNQGGRSENEHNFNSISQNNNKNNIQNSNDKIDKPQKITSNKDKEKSLAAVQKTIPLYKIWPGNNRFCLNGKLFAGPKTDRVSNTVAWILIVGIGVIYFATAFPFLFQNVDKILPSITLYLFISTVTFMILTTFTNPGIIPRKAVFEVNGEVPAPYNGKVANLENHEAVPIRNG